MENTVYYFYAIYRSGRVFIMQFVESKDLRPGMRLAKPIYNKNGVLLYERDTRLSVQVINNIQNFMLIGVYILEPAEPLPPLSKEELDFERFQTIAMFQLRNNVNLLKNEKPPKTLDLLVESIIRDYGSLDHKLNFTQNIRSSGDFVYKHSISVAILAAMISHTLGASAAIQRSLVTAALLYDYGYIFVPQEILDKGDDLSAEDIKLIQSHRLSAYELLNSLSSSFVFPDKALAYISQMVRYDIHPNLNSLAGDARIAWLDGTKILQVADAFDRMTAMHLNGDPVSELQAIRTIAGQTEAYDQDVVKALAESIHILPPGSCVDLTNGKKALVIDDSKGDFSHPLLLLFSDNSLYDLNATGSRSPFQIRDVMKTMDNRIVMDKDTLKQFIADEPLKATAERFRKKKRRKMLREKAHGQS